MRRIIGLYILIILTACAAPGQPVGEPHAATETPTGPLVQATTAPTLAAEPSAQPTATIPWAQLTVAPAFLSSVPLLLWNQNRYEIHPVDPATGQDVPGYSPFVVGEDTQFTAAQVLSADGSMLAAVESRGESCEPSAGGTACRGRADVLHLINLPAWHEVTAPLPAKGWAWPLAFSPDATRLALAYHERASSVLMLFDAGTGKLMAQRALTFRPSLMAFSQEGATLMIYGQPLGSDPGLSKPDAPHALWVEAASLDIQWDQRLTNIVSGSWCLENCQASHEEKSFADWTPAIVPSPDGRRLYIVHADAERLTTVDFGARAVRSVEIQAAQSSFERFLALTAGVAEAKGGSNGAFKVAVLSADGTKLYLLGQTYSATRNAQGDWQASEASLGLQVIDVESGHMLASREGEARWIRISPDGAHVFLSDTDGQAWWTDVLDAGSLERVARLAGWEIVSAWRMNGQPILLASQPFQQPSRLAMLDPQTFDVTTSWPADSYASWVAMP